jgi:hypothetical protein
MGRDALSLAASYLELTANDAVVLPVYTCRDILQLFLGKNRVVFYDVRPDLTIDPDEVKAKLIAGNVKMVLITNYFGFLQPYRKEIKKICQERGAYLIEDCAHSLLTEGSAETGDLSFCSFRKILPLPDGGGLKVNIEGKPATPDFYPRVYSNVLSLLVIAKSFLNIRAEKLSRARIAPRIQQDWSNGGSPRRAGRVLPLSFFAARGMANMSFPEITQKRRDDFQYWQEVCRRSHSMEPLFGDLPPGVCPFGFPVRVRDRHSLESRARNKGIYLKVHWRLDPTVGRECATSHGLTKVLLTLPLYPELKERHRDVITRLVTRAPEKSLING